jgi:Ca2+-binding RTX toxin-like protein
MFRNLIENLESRQHLSASAVIVGNELIVTGTEGADTIVLTGDKKGVNVNIGGVNLGTFKNVAKTSIFGLDGDDVITGSDLSDYVVGGAGNDIISTGRGNDTIILGTNSGIDCVNTGAGKDEIITLDDPMPSDSLL